jgi:glycogen(starch) synthase
MRILMTADCEGGVFVYALELVRELLARKCQVTLAVTGTRLTPAQCTSLRALPELDLRHRRCKLEWMEEPWRDVAATGEWLLQIAEEVAPDCIHLNEFAHGALPWPAPVMVVGHSCVLSWWQAVHHESAPGFDLYRQRVRDGLGAAQCVVAPSAAMLQELARHYGPLSHTRVIPNGIDQRHFGPQRKEQLLLCAGRAWDSAKNLSAVQRVAASLAWPTYIAGQTEAPDGRTYAFEPCRSLGELSREQLAALLARSPIYVAPARYEPYGLAILEAAASGCALVLGDIPSLRENWSGAARFVDPEDPQTLQQTLAALIADERECTQLGAHARARAATFTSTRMASAYFELYGELVSREQVSCAS